MTPEHVIEVAIGLYDGPRTGADAPRSMAKAVLAALAEHGLAVVAHENGSEAPHSEGWRYDLIDRLPDDMVIWDDDEELDHVQDRTLSWWMRVLGHETAHVGCCASCGCATTCTAGAFYDALVTSVIRDLDRIGALREPSMGQRTENEIDEVKARAHQMTADPITDKEATDRD